MLFRSGTFIKTKYGGQLLTAVGIDGNDAIYPIAMAAVETECYSSWTWFLATLKQDLNIVNTAPFTIMSDKQKVTTHHFIFIVTIELFVTCNLTCDLLFVPRALSKVCKNNSQLLSIGYVFATCTRTYTRFTRGKQ